MGTSLPRHLWWIWSSLNGLGLGYNKTCSDILISGIDSTISLHLDFSLTFWQAK